MEMKCDYAMIFSFVGMVLWGLELEVLKIVDKYNDAMSEVQDRVNASFVLQPDP